MMTPTTSIYAIVDPSYPEHYRYIGKANEPGRRLRVHVREVEDETTSNPYKANVIRKIISRGREPIVVVLAEVPKNRWETWEKAMIAHYEDEGHDLTNILDGGQGQDPEFMRRWWNNPENGEKIQRIIEGGKAAWNDPEKREEMLRRRREGYRGYLENGGLEEIRERARDWDRRQKISETVQKQWDSYTDKEREKRVESIKQGTKEFWSSEEGAETMQKVVEQRLAYKAFRDMWDRQEYLMDATTLDEWF